MDDDYDMGRFWSKEFQELYESVIVHEVASNFCVFDFASLTNGQCLIQDRLIEFGLIWWCIFKCKVCVELVQQLYANVSLATSQSHRPTLVSKIGSVDILITQDILHRLFGLSANGRECECDWTYSMSLENYDCILRVFGLYHGCYLTTTLNLILRQQIT